MFQARIITPRTLKAAFMVVSLSGAERDFAVFEKQVLHGRDDGISGGFFGVFDRRDYIHAVFAGALRYAPGEMRCFRVFDISHADSLSTNVAISMIEAIESLARQKGCQEISVETGCRPGGPRQGLAAVLQTRGFSGQSLVLSRRL